MDGWWAASYVVLWILVIVLCVLVVALARQIGTLHLRLGPRGALELDDEGPPLGLPFPRRAASDLTGRTITLGDPRQLLLFTSPGCRTCEAVLAALPAVAKAAEVAPVVITDVDRVESARGYGGLGADAVIVADKLAIRDYDVPRTPFAVILDERAIVRAKGTINNLEQLEGLVETAKARVRAAEEVRAS